MNDSDRKPAMDGKTAVSEERFRKAFTSGDVFFFAGSGISLAAGLPSAQEILSRTAKIFLPPRDRWPESEMLYSSESSNEVRLQPEVFYEMLLHLTESREALLLWDALRAPGQHPTATVSHFVIVEHAITHRLPVFTTNFDQLFEDAAWRLNAYPKVYMPNSPEERQALAEAAWMKDDDTLHLFKLHGCISRPDTLASTMRAITRCNFPAIEAMAELSKQKRCAFVGYSGSDIDFFPLLRKRIESPAFWLDHFESAPATAANAVAIAAERLNIYPSDLFSRWETTGTLEQKRAEEAPSVDVKGTLDQLETRLKRLFPSDALREDFLLALCLSASGRHREAASIAKECVARMESCAGSVKHAYFHLCYARILDCISDYDASVAHARRSLSSAQASLRGAERSKADAPLRRIGLSISAIAQDRMSFKMRIGPNIQYGNEAVAFRPSMTMAAQALAYYITGSIAIWQRFLSAKRLLGIPLRHRLSSHLSQLADQPENEPLIQAYCDWMSTRVVLMAFPLAVVERLEISRIGAIGGYLARLLDRWEAECRVIGNYFDLANVQKYRARLSDSADARADAEEIYARTADPLNQALLHRNLGERQLRSGQETVRNGAAEYFRQSADFARQCGSLATLLKALAGLYACGDASALKREELEGIRERISGPGYIRYTEQLLKLSA